MELNKVCVVFDLDDTLYKEVDFVRSAFKHMVNTFLYGVSRKDKSLVVDNMMYDVSHNGDALGFFLDLLMSDVLTKDDLLLFYREHTPRDLPLSPGAECLLNVLQSNKVSLGLMTDGRAYTQRAKINALGLNGFFIPKDILISEEFGSQKPDERNYRYFMDRHKDCTRFVFVGDNPAKDFVTANRLGWITIGIIDNGQNIHPQTDSTDKEHQPQFWVYDLPEVIGALFASR